MSNDNDTAVDYEGGPLDDQDALEEMVVNDDQTLDVLGLVSPGAWGFDVSQATTTTGQSYVVLRIEHAAGSTVIPMDLQMAEQLVSHVATNIFATKSRLGLIPDATSAMEQTDAE